MHSQQPMTYEELRALPVTVELWPTAARAFQISRTQAYKLARRGEFPTPVRRVGNRFRVNRADLLRVLGEPVTDLAERCLA